MRTKSFLVGTLIVLVLILIALAPWIDGFIFKQRYLELLAASSTGHRTVKSLDYHQGWFSSDVKVQVTYKRISKPLGGVTKPFVLTINAHVAHGPYVYDPISQHWTFALGRMDITLHFPSEIESFLLGSSPSPGGIINVTTLASFGGDFVSHFKTPVFAIQSPMGKMTWQGLNGTSREHVANKELTHVESNFTLGELNVESPIISLKMMTAPGGYNASLDHSQLWQGSAQLTLPGIFASTPDGSAKYSLNNFTQTHHFGAGSNGYNIEWQGSFDQLTLPMFAFKQSSLDLSIENISLNGLLKLRSWLKQVDVTSLSPEQFQAQYFALIPSLFTPLTVVKENEVINTSFGNVHVSGQISWPLGVKVMDDVSKQAKASLNVRASVALVNQLIDMFLPQEVANAVKAEPPSVNRLLKMIDLLSVNNQMSVDVAVQIKDLANANLAPPDFGKNIDQFVRINELSPQVASQLKMEYSDAKNPSAAIQTVPVQPQLSPRDQEKKRLSDMVQQGYITVDKNDYVALITYEQGILKTNGKVFQGF